MKLLTKIMYSELVAKRYFTFFLHLVLSLNAKMLLFYLACGKKPLIPL